MPDISILNTLIAVVIVILVLSLIVQSLQSLVKKFLKLKSRTILSSLEDLFETITATPDGASGPAPSPAPKSPQQLVQDVTDRLREMGRETLRGKPMLDSLAKGDLLKVLTRVEAEDLLPGAVDNFQAVLRAINQLKAGLADIDMKLLVGDASAKFAALQASLMPVVHDLEALARGGSINPKVLLGDLSRLRQIKAAEVLDLLGQIQQKVEENLKAAGVANDAAQKALTEARQGEDEAEKDAAQRAADEAADNLTEVLSVAGALKKIAEQLIALGTAFEAAFAPLRQRLEQAEVWYDTVMQGFEERYNRHMRTVAIIISVIVVVILNANFFAVYRAMAANPVKTEIIADRAPDILKQSRRITGTQGGAATPPASDSPTPSPTNSPTPSPSGAPVAAPTPVQGGTLTQPSPSPSPTETPVTVEDLKKQGEQVDDLFKTYKTFGIEPLTREQLSTLFQGNVSAGDALETIIGWAIMVMLLTAGAPFWQDTLESLFGLKNLLRQKTDTKNVEEGEGGQAKP